MEKIKYGDIVVSMIGQFTSDNKCWINAGFVSEAMTNENDEESSQVIWFNETTTGYGNYPIENFRHVTMDEARHYRNNGAYTIDLSRFPFYLGQRVITESKGIGTVVGISSDSTDPSYLVALDAFGTGHSAHTVDLLIGSNKSITNYNGWYSQAKELKPISTTTQVLSGTLTGTATGALSGTGQTYGYGVSGLAGHSTLGSSVGFPGLNGDCTTAGSPFESASFSIHLQSTLSRLSSKEDVKHQDAIILKSKINKRKLITI